MQSFPMFLRTTGRRVVIVGGGEQAAQKARLVLKTDAVLIIAAPELGPELAGRVASGRATHHFDPIDPALFENTAIVFVATGCAGADSAIHAIARAGGAIVNVVDRPELCDAITPAIVDRDPVVVAIGTEGTAPVLSRRIKTEIETILSPRLGAFAALAGRLRGAVAQGIPQEARRSFWAWAFGGAPMRMHELGDEAGAATLLQTALASRRVPEDAGHGHFALVGAGPGARDLLTLRAVHRLQEADLICYDRRIDPDVLELARRDAERVVVGKEAEALAWLPDPICKQALAEAAKGRRVVQLVPGDPAAPARVRKAFNAARSAGVTVEVVPGLAVIPSLERNPAEHGETGESPRAIAPYRSNDAPMDGSRTVRTDTSLVC